MINAIYQNKLTFGIALDWFFLLRQDPPLSPKDVLMVEEESREASARLAAISEDGEERGVKSLPQLGANE